MGVSLSIRDVIIGLLILGVAWLVYADYRNQSDLQSIIDQSRQTRDSLRDVCDQILIMEDEQDQYQQMRDSLYKMTIDSLHLEQSKILQRINKYRRDVETLEANFRPVHLPEF